MFWACGSFGVRHEFETARKVLGIASQPLAFLPVIASCATVVIITWDFVNTSNLARSYELLCCRLAKSGRYESIAAFCAVLKIRYTKHGNVLLSHRRVL